VLRPDLFNSDDNIQAQHAKELFSTRSSKNGTQHTRMLLLHRMVVLYCFVLFYFYEVVFTCLQIMLTLNLADVNSRCRRICSY
jgi:hypothetical protein